MTASTARLAVDGATLAYRDVGTGLPVVFQHGLGADAAQPAEILPETPALRAVTLECRGHGASPPGELPPSIARFAADLRALIDHLGLERPVLGGLSMGAAVALRLAAETPEAFSGLVLARPAWELDAAPDNLAVFVEIARLLRDHGAEAGRRRFAASETARALGKGSPDNLASALGQFDRPDPAATATLLEAIARDGPGVEEAALDGLALPTLVIGNAEDVVHPIAMAERLARRLPRARFVEIPSKTRSRAGYRDGFRAALETFFGEVADGRAA